MKERDIKKSELKDGMIVKIRINDLCLHVLHNKLLEKESRNYNILFDLCNYNDDLTHKENPDYDIIEVYKQENELIKLWKRKEIDWTKAPVDTKIYVRDNIDSNWIKSHFAKYENGKVYAFEYGTTSWTTGMDSPISWKYCKLAERIEK